MVTVKSEISDDQPTPLGPPSACHEHGEGPSALVLAQSQIPTQSQPESPLQGSLEFPVHARQSAHRMATRLHNQVLQELWTELGTLQAARESSSFMNTRPVDWLEHDYSFQWKLLDLQTKWAIACQMKQKHLLSWNHGESEYRDPQEENYQRNFRHLVQQNNSDFNQAKDRLDDIERKRADIARQRFLDALEEPQGQDHVELSIAALVSATAPRNYEQIKGKQTPNFRRRLLELEKQNQEAHAYKRKGPPSPALQEIEDERVRFLSVYQMQMHLLEEGNEKRVRTAAAEAKENQLPPPHIENKYSQTSPVALYYQQLALFEYQNQNRLKRMRGELAPPPFRDLCSLLQQPLRVDPLILQQREKDDRQRREILQMQSRTKDLVAHQEMRMVQQYNGGLGSSPSSSKSTNVSDHQKLHMVEPRILPLSMDGTRQRQVHDYVYELVLLSESSIDKSALQKCEETHYSGAIQNARQGANSGNYDRFIVIKGAVALLLEYLHNLRSEQSDVLRLYPDEAPIHGQNVSIRLADSIHILHHQSMKFQDVSLKNSIRDTCISAASLVKDIQVRQDAIIEKHHSSRGTKPFVDAWGGYSSAWADNSDDLRSIIRNHGQRAREFAGRQEVTLMIKRLTPLALARIGQAPIQGPLYHCEEQALKFGESLWEQTAHPRIAKLKCREASWIDCVILKQLRYHHHLRLARAKNAWLGNQVKRQLEIRDQRGHEHYCQPEMRAMVPNHPPPAAPSQPSRILKPESFPKTGLHPAREASPDTEWTQMSTPGWENSVDTNLTRPEPPGGEGSLDLQWTAIQTLRGGEIVVEELAVERDGDLGIGMGERTLPI